MDGHIWDVVQPGEYMKNGIFCAQEGCMALHMWGNKAYSDEVAIMILDAAPEVCGWGSGSGPGLGLGSGLGLGLGLG